MTSKQLDQYARLILFGIGEVKNRNILIALEQPGLELARILAEHLYREGARLVEYHFSDNYLKRARILHGSDEALSALTPWAADEMKAYADGSWIRVNIRGSEDDHVNQSLPADRSQVYSRTLAGISGELRRKSITFQIPWIIVLVPTREKAREAFPDLPGDEAFRRYEQGIVDVLHLDDDPLGYWERSFADLARRRTRYDELGLKKIHFADPVSGTDLSMGMIEGGRWATAEQVLPGGAPVRVNIPSCEIYTSPHCGEVEGYVKVTKPFIPVRIPGETVEGAWFRFAGGKVVECGADRGAEVLQALVDMDERAAYLGEVALVDKASAVAEQNFLFHNILFDENAASHIAIGGGFPSLVDGMNDADEASLIKRGVNQSIQHQDMMIGSDSMNVTGIDRNGVEVPLMRDGSFVEE
jgi:aminopeptidase